MRAVAHALTGFGAEPMRTLSQVVCVDPDKCVNCHACITACPVKYCNDGSGDYVKVNDSMCIGCGTCISTCTHEARVVVDDMDAFLADAEGGVGLVAIVAPSVASNFPGQYLRLNGWLKSLGVRAVFDVSFGAELTVFSYIEHLSTKHPETLISQPCPALVSYAQIYRPELLKHLAPIDSPMGHTMKMIRRFHPEYADCRIVAMSPCIAKKREFEATGLGDYNVTYARLIALLNEGNISLDDYPETPFDGPDAETAVLFSSPGGLMETVQTWTGLDNDTTIRKIEGPELVYEYLDALPEQIREGNAPNLVDCLSCSRGCNGGSGTLLEKGNLDALETAVRERLREQRRLLEELGSSGRKEIEESVRRFWEAGLYERRYETLTSNDTCVAPTEEQIQNAYRLMLKEGDADVLNCTACGYGTCEQMAAAICNGLNKPENCHRYMHKVIQKNYEELAEAQHELQAHRDHLEELVAVRTVELSETNEELTQEIDQRIRTESRLRDSEQQLSDIINFLPDATFVIDHEGKVVAWNRAMEDLTGVQASEMVGKGDQEYAIPFYGHRRKLLVDHVLEPDSLDEDQYHQLVHENGAIAAEARVASSAGKATQLWGIARALCDADGNILGAIETVRDITDRKRSEEALREARDIAEDAALAKSMFLANMSHEIRTPLNGVIGMLDLLSGTRMDVRQTRYAHVAKSSAATLLGLINDILDFSKIEAGKMDLDMVDAELPTLVEDAILPMAGRANEKGLELACSVAPDVPAWVRADSLRIRQVLVNLVGNAVKFTETGTVSVHVSLESQDHGSCRIRLAVADTGIGIPQDRINQLFQTFTQAESTTTRKYGGTGLGLAISRRLVELMGGEIDVQSEVGVGSTFSFSLDMEPVDRPASWQAPTVPAGKQIRVLAVDDNEVNRDILATQLSSWGFAVRTAESGLKAMEALYDAAREGEPFDLGVLDMSMPDMTGVELAGNIHKSGQLKQMPLILLSSLTSQLSQRELELAGFSSCLSKPVKQSDLLDAIIGAIPSAGVVSSDRSSEQDPIEAPTATLDRSAARILVAEDNEVNQEVVQEILSVAGYGCEIVDNGRKAVDTVQSSRYDVVLMDCQMPEMDGFTAVGKIRELEAQGDLQVDGRARLPVVALTANAIEGDREKCLEAGMDDYLSKPIDPDRLLAVLDRIVASAIPSGESDHSEPGPERTDSPVGCATASSPAITTSGAAEVQPAGEPEAESADLQPVQTDDCPFDLVVATKRCMGNRAFLDRLLVKFRVKLESDLVALEGFVEEANPQKVAFVAHGLKGTAANLSAESLREAAYEIEQVGKAAEISRMEPAMVVLRREAGRCLAYLDQNPGQE
jgi:PAS domain S-box-containing protein